MCDELVLRDKAGTKMRTGRLPSCTPERIWGGPGSGACCALCDQRLTEEELEYELQFPTDHGARIWHLHVSCFQAWERERQNPEFAPSDKPQWPALGSANGRTPDTL